ncbi:bacterio-opsin activator domain-containing protein [Halovivax limisalsi]|uniref:bacterio-opsin activator domain-containing protein n=1 Tax=Halovivax limisalsi TaxID=1453760 RepID=UPI001FFD7014|nr:bacterio-opsin activator domain-containing protein [Halovivax limisalsi]
MDLASELARHTLDHLSLNVALLSADGTIRASNESWRRFGRANDIQTAPDTVGENYLEVTTRGDDPYAQAAAEGIASLLDGERETFSLEYPCHSPEAERWFLLSASRFAYDGSRYVVVAHQNITERVAAEQAVDRERARLSHLLDRLSGLLQDASADLVGAADRAAVETTLCERLAADDAYLGVWVGRTSLARDRATVSARAAAPDADAAAILPAIDDEISLAGSDAEAHPLARSIDARTPVVLTAADSVGSDGGSRTAAPTEPTDATVTESATAPGSITSPGPSTPPSEIETDPSRRTAGWATVTDRLCRPDATADAVVESIPRTDDGAGGVVTVPLASGEGVYGVLACYAHRGGDLTDSELAILEALGRIAGAAIDALESRRRLVVDAATELTYAIRDPSFPLLSLARALESDVEYGGSVHRSGDRYVRFLTAAVDEATMRAAAAELDGVVDAERIAAVEPPLFELRRAGPGLVESLADRGASVRSMSATPEEARLTVDVAANQKPRAIDDLLSGLYEAVDLRGYHERDRSPATAETFRDRVVGQLTDRQRDVLQRAYLAGFYADSRSATGADLAESMGITRATFHEHRRAAERTVLAALFDPEPYQ